MKLLATIQAAQQAETRAGNREPARADDTSRQAFDGVLANVTNKQKSPAPKARSPEAGPQQRGDASTRNAATSGRDDPGASLDAGDLSGPAAQHGESKNIDDSDEAVSKLLTRLKSKDGDESSTPKADASLPGLGLCLMSSLAANPKGAAPDGGSGALAAHGTQAGGPAPEVSAGTERKASGAALQAEGAAALGVSVSTHIAPAKKGDERLQRSSEDDNLQPAQPTDAHAATSATSDGSGSSSHDDDQPAADGKSHAASQNKVEASATALGTVAPQAPIRGIAAAVAELANQASSVASAPESPKAAGTALAHTVTLQMSPGDLGTVEIRLHLTGQALDLQLTVSEQRTLGLVTRERNTLAKALETHNYELNSLVIQDGSAALPSGGTHVAKHESSGDAPAERQNGGRDGAGTQAGRGGQQRQDAERPARGNFSLRVDTPARSRGADGRSLFI